MLLYILLFGIILSLYLSRANYKRGVFLLPMLVLILEIGKSLSITLFVKEGYNGFIFIILFIYVLKYFILTKKNKRAQMDNKLLKMIYLALIIYLFFRVDLSLDNIFNMISRFGTFALIFLMFFVGYRRINNIQQLYLINRYFLFAVIIYISITVIFSILRTGPSAYREGYITGPTQFQLYFAVLPIVLALLLSVINNAKDNIYSIKRNYLKYIFVLSVIIVTLSLMRTTWLMTIVGFIAVLFFIKKNRWSRRLIFSTSSVFAIIVIFVLNSNVLDARASSFNENYDVEGEGRLVEFVLVNERLISEKSLMFGVGDLFNARGKYGFKRNDRALHGAYSNIIFGSGYIGLALVFLFFLIVMLNYLKIRTKNYLVNIMKTTGIGLVLGQMVAFFSANTTYGYGIAFFVLTFFYSGALLRLSLKYKNEPS